MSNVNFHKLFDYKAEGITAHVKINVSQSALRWTTGETWWKLNTFVCLFVCLYNDKRMSRFWSKKETLIL